MNKEKDMDELTPLESRILEFIKQQIADEGYPPTVREIRDALVIMSTGTVHKYVKWLADKGYIKVKPGCPRAIKVMEVE
jgi:repressor LexA